MPVQIAHLYKNVASQKLTIQAVDTIGGRGAIADEDNILLRISIDGAAWQASNDEHPVAVDYALPNNITGITKANPGVVSSTAHGLVPGDYVYFSGLSEMTELNGQIVKITAVTTDTFSINDTSAYGSAETTGGACGWTANFPGIYVFDLTQAETNGNALVFSAVSTTQDVECEIITAYTLTPMRGTDSAALEANVETHVQNVAEANKLDHLMASSAETSDVVTDSVIGQLASTDGDFSNFSKATDSLQSIRDRGDSAWITYSVTGIASAVPLIPNSIGLSDTATVRIGIGVMDVLADLPTTAEITPGTITIDKKSPGATSWTNVVNAAACSEVAGLIYYDEVFDSGTGYSAGDTIRVTFKSQKIVIGESDEREITGTDGWIFYTNIEQQYLTLGQFLALK